MGADTLIGGAGNDVFEYAAPSDGGLVAVNDTAANQGVSGDSIADFASGVDTITFLSSGFGNLAAGALTDGVNFSTISASYTGVNPGTNAAHDAGNASFVFSTADQTLYFDPDGTSAGYSVIASVQTGASVAASDIEIVAA